jgi:hypothetical protein
MAIAIVEFAALLGFLILAVKGPSHKKKLKYIRPGSAKMSAQYVVNKDGEIEELLNKEGKKEDY